MQFSSPQQSAQLLAEKISQEEFSSIYLCHINSDAQHYCQLIADQLGQPLNLLERTITLNSDIKPTHIVIVDDGSTRAGEYAEFSDYLRRHFPESNIIIATPFLPTSEEGQFKNACDSLITLAVEPLFFSPSQFYQNPDL